MKDILVLYYSRHQSTKILANYIVDGIHSTGATTRIRTVPPVQIIDFPPCKSTDKASTTTLINSSPPYVELKDLEECSGLALGSPTHFGSMATPLRFFWDTTTKIWQNGTLAGKPACLFTSTATMHGGQESTLMSMALPLLHHGMLLLGIPYTERRLSKTVTGGSPYGASHFSGNESYLSDDEIILAQSLGKRLANIALRLTENRKEKI